MQKKIIAVCCLIVAVTLVFASCGNKYQMIEANGVLHPVVTDAEGNTEVNNEGKIAVYVTDAHGDVVTNADGSIKKNYVEMPDVIIHDKENVVETPVYKLSMPTGWEPNQNGIFFKEGADRNCYVQVKAMKELKADLYETFGGYLDKVRFENSAVIEEMKKTYPDSVMNEETGVLSNGTETVNFSYIVKDQSGAVIHYGYEVYFCIGETVYSAGHTCINGVGYDETFDFKAIVEQNLIIK